MRESAGLLLYRARDGVPEVMLVHPGGPYWARRDEGAWTIPKGEFDADETPLDAARREFREETGGEVDGAFHVLPHVTQAGGKRVHAFAVEADFDPAQLRSNTFEIEWPPRSGRRRKYPEIDAAAWFTLSQALSKLNPAQRIWIGAIEALVGTPPNT